jgi:hypothetical protein
MLIALIVTIAAVRVRRADLAGAQTTPGTLAAHEAAAEMAEAGKSGRAGPAADDLRGVTNVSPSPDAPKPDRLPEPGRPR